MKHLTKAQLIEEIATLRRTMRDEFVRYQAQATELRAENHALRAKLDQTTEERELELEEEVERLTSELAEARDRAKEHHEAALTRDAQVAELEEEVEKLRTALYAIDESAVFAAAEKLLPAFESPHEALEVYEFRRSLDDLRDTLRGLPL